MAIESRTTEAPQTHSRRAVIAGLATMVPAAMATPALAKGQGDAALVAAADQVVALVQKHNVALDHWGACWDRYEEIKPARPKALLWGMLSPVGYARGDRHVENGKQYLWCNTAEIERSRGKTFFLYEFVGSGDSSDDHTNEFLDANWPVEGWKRSVDKPRQKRFAKLLSAYDDWKAADEAARELSGLRAAGDAVSDCEDAVWAVYDDMLEITPTTLEGYRALAKACAFACWDGKIDPSGSGATAVSKMMVALTGLPVGEGEDA